MHVVHARAAGSTAATPDPRPSLLIDSLQQVTPDLEMIARAQAFSLVDEGLRREWLRLSKQADELHAEILTQMG